MGGTATRNTRNEKQIESRNARMLCGSSNQTQRQGVWARQNCGGNAVWRKWKKQDGHRTRPRVRQGQLRLASSSLLMPVQCIRREKSVSHAKIASRASNVIAIGTTVCQNYTRRTSCRQSIILNSDNGGSSMSGNNIQESDMESMRQKVCTRFLIKLSELTW